MKSTVVCSILVLFLTGKLVLSSTYPGSNSTSEIKTPPIPPKPTHPAPENTTTSSPPTTPVTPNTTTTPIPTTTSKPTTTSTTTQSTSTSTTSTPATPTTTPVSPTTTPSPAPDRKFDSPSFIGGFVLCMGLTAIAFISWKFYKARTERNYHTL